MTLRNIPIIFLICILSSCGISKDKQESMNSSLLNELNDSFLNDSVVLPSGILVELKEVQKNNDNETGAYKASFLFTFKNFWDNSNYDVRGMAYFDSDGSIAIENGKKNIRINVISKNHKTVSLDELKSLRPKDTLGW
ncbi:MAG: hypothetical protein HDQ88_12440 [Clostridia bacterium]|nr:hypothetical protein [Clostridia bacterium]